jgi:ATP/ADP translocase/HEAT repeat protein
MVKRLFERLFKIRPAEFSLVQAFFLHFTCIGMLYTFGATAGDSLFLSNVAPNIVDGLLAWVYVGIAGATVTAAWLFDQFREKVRRATLIVGTQLVLAATLCLWRLVIPNGGSASPWLYFALVIWLEVCALLSITVFFSFAGDYFNARAAKRLYGYIAGGLALGNVLAGAAVDRVVQTIGTANLLYICAGLLVAASAVSLYVHRTGSRVAEETDGEEGSASAPIGTILAHPHIRLIFIIVLLGLTCFVLVDYQMKIVAKNTYPNTDDLAAFFGTFYSVVGFAQLVFQFLVVGGLLRRFGIIICLGLLPFLHVVMAGAFYSTGFTFLAAHALPIIAAANFFRMTITETLEMPARELSLLPLPGRIRMRAQTMMGGMLVPIGQGVGGLLIAGLTVAGFQLFQFSVMVLGCAFAWLGCLVLARPRYRNTLAESLQNNELSSAGIREIIHDEKMDFAVEELLRSGDEHVLQFTLDLLADRRLRSLAPHVAALASHANPEVASRALARLGEHRQLKYLKMAEKAVESKSPAVRTAAVLACCQIEGEKALETRKAWLNVKDEPIRHAAMVGFGRYGGTAGAAATRSLLEKLTLSSTVSDCVAAAKIVGQQGSKDNAMFAIALLEHDEPEVVRAAAHAAGQLDLVDAVSRLTALCENQELRSELLEALSEMPEEAVPHIVEARQREAVDEELRDAFVGVLATIGGPAAERALWDDFCSASELSLRVAAGRSLHHMAVEGRATPIEPERFAQRLNELKDKLRLLNRACEQIEPSDRMTWRLLRDHSSLEIECLLQLLSLEYDPRAIARVAYNLESPNAVLRANAVELLDSMLPRRIAPEIVQLLDPVVEQPEPSGKGLDTNHRERLAKMDPWLRVVLGVRSGEPDEPGHELAEWLAHVVSLKHVTMFENVAADFLIRLARNLQPMTLSAGQVLYHLGEEGRAMFVVEKGLVSERVLDREVEQVGTGDVIGEMGVIVRIRATTCVALEPTELLQISEQHFEMLVKSHRSAAIAVLRAISERLRNRTRNLDGPSSYATVLAPGA